MAHTNLKTTNPSILNSILFIHTFDQNIIYATMYHWCTSILTGHIVFQLRHQHPLSHILYTLTTMYICGACLCVFVIFLSVRVCKYMLDSLPNIKLLSSLRKHKTMTSWMSVRMLKSKVKHGHIVFWTAGKISRCYWRHQTGTRSTMNILPMENSLMGWVNTVRFVSFRFVYVAFQIYGSITP